MYQVAPTVLYLLGLPQDERMLAVAPADGGVLRAAIAEHWLAGHPVTMVAGYPGTDRAGRVWQAGAASASDPAHAEALERLRGLGYIH